MAENALDEIVIPASPNWYCSTSVSCSNDGYLAFAARNQVFIYDISTRHPKFKDSFQMYRERVTSVCWMRESPLKFAFGGEDGISRVFDTDQRKVLAESKRQSSKITAIVSAGGNIIYSGDEKGWIVSWDYKGSKNSSWLPVSAPLFCMSVAPQDEALLAVGYGNGHVLVCDAAKHNIIQHYKSHLDEVHSVAWQPFQAIPGYTQRDNGFVVASGSKDKTIRVWDIEKETPFLTLKIPTKSSSYKGRRKVDEMNRTKLWVTLCWHKKDTLISSSNSGELLIWDLKTKNSTCISHAHNRLVFNISYDSRAMKIVTTSMDRQIMFWDAETLELLDCMPTLGGYAYSATASYLDPYQIIYGVGDNLIRVWNTRLKDKPFDTNLIWQGIKSKVTIVECHPIKESIVGFGTDDGHVGVYNISSGKYQVSVTYHKKTVYSLSWGPHCHNDSESSSLDGNWLYSCGGEGVVLAHAMNNLQNKAIDINTIIKRTNSLQEKLPARSDIEWKRDSKYVALGNDDGSVEIYSSPTLLKICTILVHRKIINCMKWHDHFENIADNKGSTFSSWLATGASDNYVCVSDLSSLFDASISHKQTAVINEKFRYFNMHTQRITGLSWSPHSVELLASSSYDGSVQIWNVVKNLPIANFQGHTGRVLCVLWSLLDPDVIYSGAEDFTLRRWAVSTCKQKVPLEVKKSSSQRGSSEKKTRNRSSNLTEESQCEESKETQTGGLEEGDFKDSMQHLSSSTNAKLFNSRDPETLQLQAAAKGSDELSQVKTKNESSVKRASNKGDIRKKKAKSLFPLSSSQNHKQKSASQRECVLLAQYLQDRTNLPTKTDEFEPGINEFVNLGLFGDRVSAFKMYSSEAQNHLNSGNIEQQLHLDLWKGSLGGALRTCKENGELNEMMVAMSPLGGYDVWQATMQAYGDQLALKGDYVTAATYYVGINQVSKAIEMFKAQNMFKEAISLAKVRLPSNDPILVELYQLWGDRQSAEACYENAAKCYIASGDHKTAIKILARKGDSSSLKTAAQVALIYHEKEAATEYLRQCASILLADLNWKEVKEITDIMEDSEGIIMQTTVHELLSRCFAETEVGQALNLANIVSMNSCFVTEASLETMRSEIGPSSCALKSTRFFQVIASVFHGQTGKFPSSEMFMSKDLLAKKNDEFDPSNILLNVSFDVANGILNLLEQNTKRCLLHWLSALDILYRACQFDALEILYNLLLPRGFITFEQLAAQSLSATDRNDILALFHNFHGYYKTTILLQFWWRRFPYIIEKRNGDASCCREDILGDVFCTNIMLMGTVASELKSIEATNLVTLIGSLATSVLSPLHCRLSQLRICVGDMEQKVLELKIKKQLRLHILSKKDEEKIRKEPKVSKVAELKLSANCDDNWRGREVIQVRDESSEMKTRVEAGGPENIDLSSSAADGPEVNKEVSLLGKELDVVDDISIQSMQNELDEMKKELEKLENIVPCHYFPNGLENAKILLHIVFCSVKNGLSKDAREIERLHRIADDTVSWGLHCSLLPEEKQRFEQCRKRLHTMRK